MKFKDRVEAGQRLTQALPKYKGQSAVVLALPRGGVVLGAEIAKALSAPLDLVIPRKIGHPHNPEYAIAAVTENGDLIVNEDEVANIDPEWFKRTVQKEVAEAKRRRTVYLQGREVASIKDKIAIIVDDGIATGLTMRAAIKNVHSQQPAKIVVAVPVIPRETAEVLKSEANELLALDIPVDYAGAVGAYYQNFEQVDDREVINLLEENSKW